MTEDTLSNREIQVKSIIFLKVVIITPQLFYYGYRNF